MYDWTGLGKRRHFLLVQIPDPLEYCTYSLPFPTSLGLPCTPCDLPNEYTLYETDEEYKEQGDRMLHFEEQIDSLSRIVLPPSHRPWKIVGKDYYNHTPMIGFRDFNFCFTSQRPQVRAYYQSKYVGRVEETTILNLCCCVQKYQEFKIYQADDTPIFRVTARSGQPGQIIILPFWGFDKVRYSIRRISQKQNDGQDSDEDMQQPESLTDTNGEIVHLFSGFREYTSKLDRFGITMPEDATQQEKISDMSNKPEPEDIIRFSFSEYNVKQYQRRKEKLIKKYRFMGKCGAAFVALSLINSTSLFLLKYLEYEINIFKPRVSEYLLNRFK